MNHFYQKKIKSIIGIILLVVACFFNNAQAQTVISTQSGTNYTGANGVTANGAITFVVQNTNASPIVITQVDAFWAATLSGVVPKLWYSTTSLSGAPTITAPNWTLAATGTALTIPSDGYYPTLTGLSISIPANTQYRFAIEGSNGVSYSGSGAVTPTPNSFSAGGVTLKCGNNQISAANVGYGGGFPSPANNPRFFTGRITFQAATAPSCASNLAPVNNAVDIAPNGSLTWNAAAGASSYDVYLGTAVNPPFVANVTGTSYTFSPALTLNELYFYKIVPKNSVGSASGCPVNAFTTVAVFCNPPTVFTTSPDTSFCGSGSATLTVRTGTLNDAAQYSWYTGSCGGTLVGTGRSLTVSPATTTTYYVRPDGGCVGTAGACSTVVVTKTTSIGAPVINAVPAICLNSVGTLSIDPLTIIRDSVFVESAPGLSLAVPDETVNGVSTTLTVPAIPAGSIITGIEVSLTMAHTYPGDMIFNLKAPNGNILNLYKYGTGLFTGAAAVPSGAGWVNTVISSASTRAFSTVNAAPYAYGPGPFRADAINTPVTGPTVQNPVGFVSNVTTFANLYSIPAGTWTLAMADGGPGDLGTLTRWTIKIKYSSTPTPASPAIWSPAATLFTNPAATVPYDGTTPTFTVYAKPSTTTTYTAISSSGSCTSAPVTVQQVVSIPAKLSPIFYSKAICEFDNSFLVAPYTGTKPSFQWYARNENNVIRKLVANDTFSGVTSDTLFFKNLSNAIYNNSRYYCKIVAALPCTSTDGIDSTLDINLIVNPTPTVQITSTPDNTLLPGQVSLLTATSNPQSFDFKWFKNNLPIYGSTGLYYPLAIDSLGTYKVSVVDVNGCKNTSGDFDVVADISTKLFIYPNPNTGNFQVRFYSANGNRAVRSMLVYDSKGALVYTKSYTTTNPYGRMDVDFTNFSRGIYVVNLLDASGKRLATGKVSVTVE